jgi:hypothetical protein
MAEIFGKPGRLEHDIVQVNLFQENQTRNHKFLNIGITDRYILHMQALHAQIYKWNAKKMTTIMFRFS